MSSTSIASPGPHPATIRRAVLPALVGKVVEGRARVIGVASFYMLLIGAVLGLLWAPMHDVFRNLPTPMVDLVKAVSGGTDLSTPVGWANAELLSVVAPAAVILVAVMSAAAATAGEEEDRTLGLTLSATVGRTTYLLAAMAGMAISVLILSVCIGLGLVVGDVIGGLGYSATGIVGVMAHAFVFGALFGSLAFLLGAATGSRRIANLGSALVAVLAFAANTFLPLEPALAGGQRFSPWYYYNSSDPLLHGASGGDVVLLAGVAVVLAAAAVLVFRRRDLRG